MGKEKIGNTVKRLIWLLDTIYRAGDNGISRREISERWQDDIEMSGGEEYPLRTFRNHIDRDIPDIFDIEIECIKGNKYRIKYPEDVGRDALTGWIVETLSLKNIIAGDAKLRNRILFEPAPAGEHLLRPIIDAIKDSATVRIDYQRFHENQPAEYTVEPYFLKLFRRRWYLVGYCREMGRIYTFSLDRLQRMSRTEESFTIPDINEDDFFGNSFGIIWSADDKPNIVKIRVYGEQADYIRSLSLHNSQKEVATEPTYADFEYFVLITYDFVQELLSHGENVEVLEPVRLREEMKRHAEAMMQYYQ
jgi:hypothetical protein